MGATIDALRITDETLVASCEVTILMPCLDEAETIVRCIEKATRFLTRSGIDGEILIADNGSRDGSDVLAHALGARVISVPDRGYGAALKAGIAAARGRFVIMGDADDSYDFERLDAFVTRLRAGDHLVMGNRFRGRIDDRAMPLHHRYLGNPILSGVGRLLFQTPIGDFHCGLRGFDRDAMLALDLTTNGMEFASEMVVKASLKGLRVSEVPTTLARDGRSRPPHLRSWHDGWRHLKFLLVHSPRWLFLFPGIGLMTLGCAMMIWLMPGPRWFLGVTPDITALLYSGAFIITGLQLIVFALFSKLFGVASGMMPPHRSLDRFIAMATLDRGILVGLILIACGLFGTLDGVLAWRSSSFGALVPDRILRIAIPSTTALGSGTEVLFASFLLHWIRSGISYKR